MLMSKVYAATEDIWVYGAAVAKDHVYLHGFGYQQLLCRFYGHSCHLSSVGCHATNSYVLVCEPTVAGDCSAIKDLCYL